MDAKIKQKIKSILYNRKYTTSYDKEDPFVGLYFNDLVDLLEDYKNDRIDYEQY